MGAVSQSSSRNCFANMEISEQINPLETAKLVHWVSSVPVGLILCFSGICLNVISIIVWLRIRSKMINSNSTITYFICMGAIDSGLLVMFILTDTIPATGVQFTKTYGYCVCFCYIFFPTFFYMILCSI